MTSVRSRKYQDSYLCVLEAKALRMSVRETCVKCGISMRQVYQRQRDIVSDMRRNLLDGLINDMIPAEYSAQLALNNIIIQRSMKIADEAKDKRIALEGLRLASQTQVLNEKLMVDSVAIGKAIQSQLQRIQPLSTTNIPKKPLDHSPINIIDATTEDKQEDNNDKEIMTP